MVAIRLKKMGRKKKSFFRIVVADSKNRRDGAVIEELGYYYPGISPKEKVLKEFFLDLVQYQHWVSLGAQPSESVKILAKRSSL